MNIWTYMFFSRPLPEVPRIPAMKLSGEGFANLLMVFEFIHNFGHTLGFGKGVRQKIWYGP